MVFKLFLTKHINICLDIKVVHFDFDCSVFWHCANIKAAYFAKYCELLLQR